MFGNTKKLNKILTRPSFIVLAAILAATAWVLLLGDFRAYKSEVSVLLIPKSEKAAIHSEQIANNLIDISQRLSFYEKMIKEGRGIDDVFKEYSKDDKKKLWNDIFKAERGKGTTIIDITVSNVESKQSQVLAKQASSTMLKTASFYYNIKDEISFRLIEGPSTSVYIKNWHSLLIISLAIGILLSFLLHLILLLPKKSPQKKPISRNEPVPTMKEEVVETPQPMKSFTPLGLADPPIAESPAQKVRKSAAPENLPIGNGDLEIIKEAEEIDMQNVLQEFDSPVSEKSKSHITENNIRGAQTNQEPTENEYKKRLNQLLKGNLHLL